MVSRAGHSADLSGAGDDARAVPLRQRLLAARRRHARLFAARPTRRATPRSAASAGRRARSRSRYILDSDRAHARARTRSTCAAPTSTARRAQRHAVRPARSTTTSSTSWSTQLEADSDYRARRDAIAAFNADQPGAQARPGADAAEVRHLVQRHAPQPGRRAGARLHRRLDPGEPRRHRDGPGPEHQGGAGGGARARRAVRRACACTATDTQKVANTSATAASTGSDLNGKAAQDAARQIRERLAAFAAGALGGDAERRALRQRPGRHGRRPRTVAFRELVAAAYMARVQLWSDGFYATPGLSWDSDTMQGQPFFYFAYGAAVSEVVVDTLTGEWKLLRADVLHDAGRSLNPAVDIGQVEGAFIQGMGWLTMEELVWHPPTVEGRLLTTHAPSTYKIPTANDCPPVFNVRLFEGDNVARHASTAARRSASRRCCCRSRCSSRSATRSRRSGGHRVDPPLNGAGDERGDPARDHRGAGRRAGRDGRMASICGPAHCRWLAERGRAPSWSRSRRRAARCRAKPARACWSAPTTVRRHDRRRPPRTEGHRARRARMLAAAAGAPRIGHFPLGPALGQCCGGAVTLRSRRSTPTALAAWPARAPALSPAALRRRPRRARDRARCSRRSTCSVDWIDEREDEFPRLPRRPRLAARTSQRVCVDAVAGRGRRRAPPGAFYLVLTHRHDLDLRITEAILRRGDFGFFGLIGSRTKRRASIHRFERRAASPPARDRAHDLPDRRARHRRARSPR